MENAFTSEVMSRRDARNLPGATTYLERFIDALGLLCREKPSRELCEAWLSGESEELQAWTVNHVRVYWASGIGTIEAAQHMADVPEESEAHEGFFEDTGRASPNWYHVFAVVPVSVESPELPKVEFRDFLASGSTAEKAAKRLLESYVEESESWVELWAGLQEQTPEIRPLPHVMNPPQLLEQHENWKREQEHYVLLADKNSGSSVFEQLS